MAEGSALAASDPSGLGALSLKSELGEGSALADSVGEADTDPDSAGMLIDSEAEPVGSLFQLSPPEAEADGSVHSPPPDEGATALADAEGPLSDQDSVAEASADQLADGCSPPSETEAEAEADGAGISAGTVTGPEYPGEDPS